MSEAAIGWARGREVWKVVLVSSTKFERALRLYERMGFVCGPLPLDPGYAVANVYMELAL